MIGVIADAAEHDVVREFFELFKTPWEFFREERVYDVLLCTGEQPVEVTAKLVVRYAGKKTSLDELRQARVIRKCETPCVLSYQSDRLPIYGASVTFAGQDGILKAEETGECAAFVSGTNGFSEARIGYDLFAEVRILLTEGQPHANAGIPALEAHIAVLRDLITGCGIPLVEIPAVPEGFQFIACLTHDVDHPSIRQHKLDHTVAGFLFRATVASLVDALLGRMAVGDMFRNWGAAISLPFVYAGITKDFWRDFDQRYLELEKEIPSTFFFIARKNDSGKQEKGPAPALRASPYRASEVRHAISKLKAAGREVGLHGLDAWLDSSAGRAELDEIRKLTGEAEIGVRMHWLYFRKDSPATLEEAGAAYDSTFGYNQTVGYRAGTAQAYRPPGAEKLLELPMLAMDTALFYLSYLGLSPRKANQRLRQLTDNAVRYGGCVTINWHDRSLAPERLWGQNYRELIQDLKNRGAWFSTAMQAVSWFRKRRSATFMPNPAEPHGIQIAVAQGGCLPGLRLRVHAARKMARPGACAENKFTDFQIRETPATIPSTVGR
jgi:hypothetical protein